MSILGEYKNGNFSVTLFSDGTKIRETEYDEFIPAFAESQDIKISNQCEVGCPFCHEGSTKNGKVADIMNEKFIDTLHPYQEVAIGGGSVTDHPDLIPFLRKLREKKVIPNITVNQFHFMKHQELIRQLVDDNLIFGLGVSLVYPTEEFIELVQQYPNAVIHVINGILTPEELKPLANKNLKMLILGYKDLRRDYEMLDKQSTLIESNQQWLKNGLENIINQFKVVSFDNLAIEQLEVQRLLTPEEWGEFYMGNDGTMTFYIDVVERKFARNSTADFDKRYELLDSVDEMFGVIVNNNKEKSDNS